MTGRNAARPLALLAKALPGVLAAALAAPLVAAAPAAAAACPAPGGKGVADAAAPAGAEVAVLGHGFGHGLGMSQYGAQGAARLGCGHVRILQAYYRGAKVVDQAPAAAPVVLTLLDGGRSATVSAEDAAVSWSAAGASGTAGATQPKGATWTVVPAGGGLAVREGSATRLSVPAGAQLRADGGTWRVRTYGTSSTPAVDLRMRWDHTRFTADAGALDAAQVLQDTGAGTAVQKYLRGLREVPVTWPQEALRAQVVAARTYLLGKYSSTAKAYVLRTTTADQNYGGAAHEDEDARHGGGWRAAVDATPGRVVVDAAGKRIDALYSSSAGGWTEDRQYVWGSYGIDYLKPLDDSAWDAASDNPYRAWAVGLTRAQVATALGFDSVASVSVAARGSGARVGGVTVTGVDGGRSTTRTFTGDRVRTALRLRSSGVTFRVAGTATTAAPAPAVPAPSGPPVSAPVVGDWDADGRDDAGWYASGRWTLRRGDGTVVRLAFGSASDVPVVGDWDGDGRDGVGVYRKGHWFLRGALSTGPADAHLAYGATTDRPVVGAWAGGARDGVGVVRGNQWLLRPTATPGPPTVRALLGRASDGLLPGDWDGDGVDSPGVRRGGTSYLAARSSTTAVPTTAVPFGGAADRAVAGDWDGDRRATPGVVRGTAWHLRDDLRGGAATRSYALVP